MSNTLYRLSLMESIQKFLLIIFRKETQHPLSLQTQGSVPEDIYDAR